jgi:Bacterial Ig-like domain (group 1)
MQRGKVGYSASRFVGAVVGGFMVLAGAACSDSSSNSAPLVATSISATAASQSLSGVVGQAVAVPVTVLVTDQNGAPLANATVSWSPSSSSGSVSAVSSTTDASGVASVTWTLGTVAGVDSLTAQLAGGASVIITAAAAPSSVTSLTIMSGDNQSVAAGSTTAPMIVKAVDQFGNAVPGTGITWSSASGGALSAELTITDASGQAHVTLATDPSVSAYSVTAAAANASVSFTVSAQ